MPIGATSRDVKIRITGENLVGPAVQGARQQLQLLDKSIGSIIGGKAGKFFGAAATGGAAGLIAGTAAGTFAPALMGQVASGLQKTLDYSEQIAKVFGVVTERARELSQELQNTSKSLREATQKTISQALQPSQKAREGLFALPGLASLFGGRQGQYAAALSDISAQRDSIARERGSPFFQRAVSRFLPTTLQQVQDESWGIRRGMAGYVDLLSDNPLSRALGIRPANAGEKINREELGEARYRAGILALKEAEQRENQFLRAEKEIKLREDQIRAAGRLELGIAAFPGIASRISGQFGGFGTAGQSLLGGLLSGVSGFQQARQMNIAGRLATESPVETLRRELGNLDRDRRQGLSAEVFSRRRNMLLKDAIAGLDAGTRTPDLVAAESRYLTRGRDRDPVQAEIAEWRKEQRDRDRRNQELLKELIKVTKAEAAVKVEVE